MVLEGVWLTHSGGVHLISQVLKKTKFTICFYNNWKCRNGQVFTLTLATTNGHLKVGMLDLCEDLQNIIRLLNDRDRDLKFECDIPKHTGNKFLSKCIRKLGGSNNIPYHEATVFTL